MTSTKKVSSVITAVEAVLCDFYRFEPLASAATHLIQHHELLAIDQNCGNLAEAKARAGVWFVEDPENLFIGMYLHNDIVECLSEHCPIDQLNNDNLDAFCTVVEEISHFHLILNRLQNQTPVSKLELESVGEIDKLLVSSIFLKKQSGRHHIEPLAMTLYDRAILVGFETKRYEEATKVAARFWYSILRSLPNELELERLRQTLQDVYRQPGTYRRLAS